MSHTVTRRDFAKAAGAAALGASAAPALGAAVPPQPAAGSAPQATARAHVSRRLSLGNRHRLVSGRGRRQGGRPRAVDLGHLLAHARQGREQRHRRRRRRPLPPLQGRRAADEGAGREGLPLLDRLAARVPAGRRRRRTRRGSTSTTAWSTSCSPTASSRSPRSITGTCRSRCRIAAGGWESRDTAKAFADYAGYVAERLTDRVKHIFTINEFGAFVELGYRVGIHAPGPQAAARPLQPDAPSRGARPRPRRAGDPRARQAGHEGRARGEHDHLRARSSRRPSTSRPPSARRAS